MTLVAGIQVEVGTSNVEEVAKALTSGTMSAETDYYIGDSVSPKVMKRLAKVPSDKLSSALDEAPTASTRGVVAKILAFKGEPEGFRKVVQVFARGDIEVDAFTAAAKLYKSLSLPADFQAAIDDASLPCGVRHLFIDLLAIAPSAQSVSLIEDIYGSPAKQACKGTALGLLDSNRLVDALGKLGRPEAVAFLRALPRCKQVKKYRNAPAANMPNPNRSAAIRALLTLGGDQAFDALVSFASEKFTNEELKTCRDPERGTYTPEEYPWRKGAMEAISTMKGLRPEQLARVVSLVPTEIGPILALLNLGKPARTDIDKLFDKPRCAMVTTLVDSRSGDPLRDRAFLAESKMSEAVRDLLSGLAARQSSSDAPKSRVWDAIRVGAPKCLEQPESHRGLIRLAGELGDGKAASGLVSIYDKAAEIYPSAHDSHRIRTGTIEALGWLATEPAARSKLKAIAAGNDSEYRDEARRALAAGRSADSDR